VDAEAMLLIDHGQREVRERDQAYRLHPSRLE
jgi:hypothetical protein